MSDRNKRKPKQGGKNVNIETKRSNRQFALLTAIAMVLVIMGHVNEQLLTFGGLFPYYSFHIALFLFISGYFYKEYQEEKIPSYIVKKAKLSKKYDKIYFPCNIIDKDEPKYFKRDKILIDKSNICFFYCDINKNKGRTKRAYEYALLNNKKIVNFYDYI